jgi:gliding motility-associated-like protein
VKQEAFCEGIKNKFMRKIWGVLFLVVCLSHGLYAQTTAGMVAHLNFNNCEVFDATGNNTDIVANMPPMCDCGMRTGALEFDGSDQFINFGEEVNLNELFTRATFSISFYFRPLANTGNMVLFSKRESCTAPQGFAVYYNAQSRQLTVELTESATIQSRLIRNIPTDRCWHHVVITRIGTNVRLFVDNVLLGTQTSSTVVNLTNQGQLQIGTGVCIGSTAVPFNGLISDLRFYNRDIQELDIAGLFLNQDKFFNRDTTIFLSSSVQINTGPSCTDNIIWAPTSGLDNPASLNPLITPDTDETYVRSVNYGNCVARDTIQITVIDPSDIDCAELPMPNIFTPNNDGLNDRYGISNPFSMEGLVAFDIYDRNGSKVFASNDRFASWDGSFNGMLMPPGAYLYMIRYICDGSELVKTGSFHLIR